jgi:transitional endoplasmic reticulum ATPase
MAKTFTLGTKIEKITGAPIVSEDIFISKIMVNLLKTWKPSFTDDLFLQELQYRPGKLRGKWNERFDELKEAHLEAEGESKNQYVSAHKFIQSQHVSGFVDAIMLEHPELEGEWKFHQNTVVLGEILELSPTEMLIFDYAMRTSIGIEYDARYVFDKLGYSDENKDPVKCYSRMFQINESDVKEALKGFLFKSGLLIADNSLKIGHMINEDMAEAFTASVLTLETLEETLFPSSITTDLTIENYPHFAKEISRTEDIINQSLPAQTRGINVMFWGLPGTGKTELAVALAKKNGWKLKIIGDVSDADASEKSRTQRLTSLKIAMKLYGRDEKTVLLFDEMEDLFKSDQHAQFSKAFINRIIETTQIPIIWTTNDLYSLGSAVLRRMVYNIAFEVPPVSARKKIWQNYTKKYGVELSDDMIDDLATTFNTVPALISNAVKISTLAKLPPEEIPEVLTSLDRLMNYGEERKFPVSVNKSTPYDASCANTDYDLNVFTEQLMRAKPHFSLLLYGAPGTGKSEYGRYLAKKLGKRVLFRRASDLQSMWLGECEKNIAKAFKEAKDGEQVLIIDEGDTFLQNRENAERSWEVSQVNEMLSQMETSTQPFILTTNLMKDLDPASMRRFTFKLKFDFMKPEQSRRLFKAYFNVDAPVGLDRMDILAPGDFANIKSKAEILGITDGEELLEMLREECKLKPQFAGTPMGFSRL